MSGEYRIAFDGVTFHNKRLYGNGSISLVLTGITLLLGKSGVGKSTFLKQLFLNLSNNATLVSQSNDLLINHLSVIENIHFFDYSKQSKITVLLKKIDFDYILTRETEYLSGGEKRIVLILRAFFSDKKILLIDEPTNNLDNVKVNQLINILKILSKEKSILIVTHDDRLSSLTDSIIKIVNGNIIQKRENSKHNHIYKLTENVVSYRLDKFFRKNIFNNFILFFFIISFIVSTYFVYYATNKYVDNIEKNQIDICSTLFEGQYQLVKKGYLPVSIFSEYDEKSLLKENELVNKYIEHKSQQLYSLNLYIGNSSFYDSYNLVYLDYSNDNKYYVLENYKYYFQNEYGSYPLVNDWITIDKTLLNDFKGEVVESNFNEEIYFKVIQDINSEIENEDLQIVYISIIYNKESSFEEILNSDNFNDIIYGNYYIRSNETINIYNAMIIDESVNDATKILLLSSLMYIILMLFNLFMDLRLCKKTFISVRNIGCRLDDVLFVFNKNNSNFVFKTTFVIMVVFAIAIFTLCFEIQLISLLGIIMCSLIPLVISKLLTYFISRKYITRLFNFGGLI